jgi:hypothetical protein
MKLFFTGAPVSPEWTDVYAGRVMATVAVPRCSALVSQEVPFAGLVRTRAYADLPSADGVTGPVSPRTAPGTRPAGMRKRQQHIDLDPQRPRPSGGCG